MVIMSDYEIDYGILITSIFSVSVGVFGILIATYIMYVRLKFKSSQRNEETPFHTLSIADEETYRLRCRLFGLEEEEIDTTTI